MLLPEPDNPLMMKKLIIDRPQISFLSNYCLNKRHVAANRSGKRD
jgi:hypothetical protein